MKSGQMRRRNLPAYAQKIKFSDVCHMIDQMAHKYSQSFGIPFEEVQAEGNYLFIKAIYHFNPHKKTKFSTFLHLVLNTGFISYGQARKKKSLPIENPVISDDGEVLDPLDNVSDEKASKQYAMIDFYQSLSNDEKQLVDLILDGFTSTLAGLKHIATQRLNFGEARFNIAVSKIKEHLSEMAI